MRAGLGTRVALVGSLAVLGALASCTRAPDLPAGPGIRGVLVDEDANPLPYRAVMACTAEFCLFGDSDARGEFSFSPPGPGEFLIKTAEDLSSTPRRSSPMVPVRASADRFVDIGGVYVPSLPEGVSIDPNVSAADFQVGDGLTLGLDLEALDLKPGEVLEDLAARRLPERMIPDYPALEGESVIAVYAVHPFAAASPVPIRVRVASSLPAGTRVRFRTIDEVDGSFSDPVPGVATGEALVTEPGEGIGRLTHLVVSR